MKTIKVIDLYNRVAIRKDIPKTIKYDGLIYNWDKNRYLHYGTENSVEHSFLEGRSAEILLNDEVEIIEDEIDIQGIEELELTNVDNKVKYKSETGEYAVRLIDIDMMCKINELIKAQKQLDRKLKEIK